MDNLDHVSCTGRLSPKRMTEQQEPYEPRGSRTDLWGPRGEIPLGYPADVRESQTPAPFIRPAAPVTGKRTFR